MGQDVIGRGGPWGKVPSGQNPSLSPAPFLFSHSLFSLEIARKFFFFFLIRTQLIYNVVSVSVYSIVTQSYMYIFSFSHTSFHHGLSQETGYSSLCCTVGPHCSSILNIMVCIYQPLPVHPTSSLLPPGKYKSVLHFCNLFCFVDRIICVIFQILHVISIVFIFLFLTYFIQYENPYLLPCCS